MIVNDPSYENPFDLDVLFSSLISTYLFEINNDSTVFEKHKQSHKMYELNEAYIDQISYPAQSVIIIVPSNATLPLVLQNMKNSIWWKHQAMFFIFNNNVDNSCHMARALLKTVWAFNILSAVYLCRTVNNQMILYTFNPYSNSAPTFWRNVENKSNESWTLFEHPIEQSYEYFSTFGK